MGHLLGPIIGYLDIQCKNYHVWSFQSHRVNRVGSIRNSLNHRLSPQNVRVSAARSGSPAPFTWIRILEPRGCSSSMLHSETGTAVGFGSSIKVGPDPGTVTSEG